MSILCLYLNNILTEVIMSTDTNSMLSAIFDTTVNNIQEQQKQDSLNYSIFELRKALKEISDELDILVKRIETIKEVS